MNEQIKTYFSAYGSLALRLLIGIIFVVAGFGKLTGLGGFAGALSSWGFPISGVLAVIIAILELVGGLWLISGWNISWPSSWLSIIMLVAILAVHLGDSWSDLRYVLLLFLSLVYLIGHKPTFGIGCANKIYHK